MRCTPCACYLREHTLNPTTPPAHLLAHPGERFPQRSLCRSSQARSVRPVRNVVNSEASLRTGLPENSPCVWSHRGRNSPTATTLEPKWPPNVSLIRALWLSMLTWSCPLPSTQSPLCSSLLLILFVFSSLFLPSLSLCFFIFGFLSLLFTLFFFSFLVSVFLSSISSLRFVSFLFSLVLYCFFFLLFLVVSFLF